jgi:hypothetical protein
MEDNQKKYIGINLIAVFVTVLFCSLIFWLTYSPQDAYAGTEEIVDLSTLPENVQQQIENDMNKAGMYIYTADVGADTDTETETDADSDGNNSDSKNSANDYKYVLLTFGRVPGITMTVDVQDRDNNTVYFNIGTEEIQSSDSVVIKHVYKTKAIGINCNEMKLINPFYAVGTTGFNIGWVQTVDGDECYITPLMDLSNSDRIFKFDTETATPTVGLYQYSYEVESSCVRITSLEKLSEYDVWAKVEEMNDEEKYLTLGVYDTYFNRESYLKIQTENVGENVLNDLKSAYEYGYKIKVTLQNNNGTLSCTNVR